ncbi:MAG: hypothetical protein WKG07_18805 [Hymenobacter sp.]
MLAEGEDIIQFQYIKKNNKEKGPVFIGIEVKARADVNRHPRPAWRPRASASST